MKITHVISDSNVGGAGVLLCSLAKRLSDYYDIEVIVPYDSALSERLAGTGAVVKELPMASDRSFKLSDARGFYKYFSKNRTDFIHTHASLGARLGAAMAGIRPCISTRHCAIPPTKDKIMSPIARTVYDYCTDLTVSTADCATKNLVKEGVKSEKIVTIKNGVDSIPILDIRGQMRVRHELGIPDGAKIIGCCGRLESVKGQDLLLRAAARLLKSFPDVYFLLVGDGSKKSEYKLIAARLGILSHVRFTGYVPSAAPYQNIFYINVNTSRGTETSSLATSECMSAGIPTVASDFGGNREMIKDGESGLLFPTDNVHALEAAIARLLLDAALCEKLSVGAKERWRTYFSLERMAEDYRRLYESHAR